MGVLNVTPDSFSDGGKFDDPKRAETHILQMISDGADIIDIGGESTGPMSKNVSFDEEMKRVKPVIDFVAESGLSDRVIFSIDTYKAPVAEYALMNGFQMVNDVTALRGDPNMAGVLLKYQPYTILMYSKDPTPRTTKDAVKYKDVVKTVKTFLSERADLLLAEGFPKDRIILDPGMGMFVSAEPKYSFEIIERLGEIKKLGHPICIGVSYKSFLGGPIEKRGPASVEWSLKAIKKSASIVRVHDVAAMKKALKS